MIVYGDPEFNTSMTRMRDAVDTLIRGVDVLTPRLDGLRGLLIACGEWEQAAFDADDVPNDLLPHLCDLTDCAADAFCIGLSPKGAGDGFAAENDLKPWVDAVRAQLSSIEIDADVPLRVKIPEGFAVYGLYPEQYVAAARLWGRDYAGMAAAARACVVGLRSIGTTLSAVVASTLRFDGWRVSRFTVRPHGDPFERRVTLPAREASILGPSTLALIVDEGPGLSGSSIAAAARAVIDAGVQSRYISLLPGHDGLPGAASSEDVRRLWEETRRYVLPADSIRWNSRSPAEHLGIRTIEILQADCSLRDLSIEDFGGGMWRAWAYDDPALWPPSRAPFERPKYRVSLPDGRSILWRFAGLPIGDLGTSLAEIAYEEGRQRADRGWSIAPVGIDAGFVATPWVRGERFVNPWLGETIHEDETIARLGRYVADTASVGMRDDERVAAFDRLADMLLVNVVESLGNDCADEARRRIDEVRELCVGDEGPANGDGRMAPHEWIRAGSGAIVKANAVNHAVDHTMVGRQPAAWDLAGAIVEWGLDEFAARALVREYVGGGGSEPAPAALAFYCLCYAGLRLGACRLGVEMAAANPIERTRQEAASNWYRRQLEVRLCVAKRKAA